MQTSLEQLREQLPEPDPTEDGFTKTVEKYTATIPSSMYLSVAVGATRVTGFRPRQVGQFYSAVGSYLADYRRL